MHPQFQRRVSLIGDAAHPMVPLRSNGASQAILDAAALAAVLAGAEHGEGAIAAALARYEAGRLPKTSAIVANNRRGLPLSP